MEAKEVNDESIDMSSTKCWNQYMTLKRHKLVNQLTNNGDQQTSDLLATVCIYINGVTDPPEVELKELVVRFGGMYLNYLDSNRVTHIIASSMAFAKAKRNIKQSVVKVEWLLDSIANNCLQPIHDYLLVKRDPTLRHEFVANASTEQTNGDRVDATVQMTTVCEPVLNEEVESEDNTSDNWAPIDRQFIDSLPEELREEILADIELFWRSEDNNKRKMRSDESLTESEPKKCFADNSDDESDEESDDSDGGYTASNICANICGKYDTQEVMDLFEEWIVTEEDLIDEDIAYVTKYFVDLIDEQNYNQFEIIFEKFYICVQTRGQRVWKQCFNNIRNTVYNELNVIRNTEVDKIVQNLPNFDLN